MAVQNFYRFLLRNTAITSNHNKTSRWWGIIGDDNSFFSLAAAQNAGPSFPSYIPNHLFFPIVPTLSPEKVPSLVATKIDAVTTHWQTYEVVFFCLKNFQMKNCFVLSITTMLSRRVLLRTSSTQQKQRRMSILLKMLDQTIFSASNCGENIYFAQNQGLQVDNYNEPAPENIPLPNQTQHHN